MIVTRSYFVGRLQIANAEDSAPNSNLLGNASMLQDFINIYERELLSKLFGFQMYAEFSEQFDIDPDTQDWTIKADADQKWKDLLKGATYQMDGIEKRWKGLIQVIGGTETSFIANYIYCNFLTETELPHSGVGFVVPKSKNAIRVSAASHIARAWNDMVMDIQGDGCRWEDYPEKTNVPLTVYLKDNPFGDQPKIPVFEFQNRWGL